MAYDRQLSVMNFGQWKIMVEEWLKEGGRITNEYGDNVPFDRLLSLIENKRAESHNHALRHPSPTDWVDDDNNFFSDNEFS